MADERETIIEFICDALRDVPGVALVTRYDHRAVIGSLNEWPAICVVDMGDEVIGRDSQRTNHRHMRLALVSVLQGTSEDTVGSEMATFNDRVKRQFYGVTLHPTYTGGGYTLCPYIDDAYPLNISPLAYVKAGSRVACQGQEFRILYQESIYGLWVEPTN